MKKYFILQNLFLLAIIFNSTSVFAANITWSSATKISGDGDISTTGTLKYAYNWSGGNQNINGVTFTGTSSTANVGSGAPYDIVLSRNPANLYDNIGLYAPYSQTATGLSAAYLALLNNFPGTSYSGSANAMDVTLQNLTIGTDYSVQVWVNISYYATSRTVTFAAGNTATLYCQTGGGTSNYYGQYVIGTFTANATTQIITVSGSSNSPGAILCGIQVRSQGGVSAPGPLTYSIPSATYTVNTAIATNTCTNAGGASSTFSISPSLPSGLVLDTTNGNITGTPTASSAGQTYVVTATNAYGSGSGTVTITVTNGVQPPGPLTYSTNPANYTIGSAIATNVCTNGGGASSTFGISPSLPAGLSLNGANGNLTGAPIAALPPTTYTITATNAGGSATVGLIIAVTPPGVIFWQTPNNITGDTDVVHEGSPLYAYCWSNASA
ncbi:MAG: putative Ig domain-containing protein, partial [Chitinivibrionales bacterium]|nr:putative Ig domain-containing protein [Chitinivibrionales bacterium]